MQDRGFLFSGGGLSDFACGPRVEALVKTTREKARRSSMSFGKPCYFILRVLDVDEFNQ